MDMSPLWISLKTAIPATVITFLLGIFAAQRIVKTGSRLRSFFDIIFTLPLVLPPTVAGFLLLLLFGKHGFLGKLLHSMGVQIIFTWSATVVAAVVVAFPLMYRSAKGAFLQVDQDLISAGRTLGMSELKIFWRIIMPLALPGVASGGILTFARILGEFGATLMIAGNIPKVTQTMPLAIYMEIQGGNMKQAATWVIVLLLISFGILFIMNSLTAKDTKFKWGGEGF